MLITENIDDLHAQEIRESDILMGAEEDSFEESDEETEVSFLPHVFEIVGNIRYMHCSDECQEHARKFKVAPTLKQVD